MRPALAAFFQTAHPQVQEEDQDALGRESEYCVCSGVPFSATAIPKGKEINTIGIPSQVCFLHSKSPDDDDDVLSIVS